MGSGGGGMTSPPGVAPAAAVGAGSYTQMMQAPAAPQSLIGQPAGGAKAPVAAKKKGIPPLVFIGAGLLMFLIIVVVLVIVMRKPA
jgi:tellurite resistance protein TehA-like permease